MKRILFSLLLLTLFLVPLAQAQPEWDDISEIYDDGKNYGQYENLDSMIFFYEDTVFIAGGNTLYLFVNSRKTMGNIRFHGYAWALDTLDVTLYSGAEDFELTDPVSYSGNDTLLIFSLAAHTGSGQTALNTNETESYTAVDTALTGSTATAFDFYVKDVTAMQTKLPAFYTLRMAGGANRLWGVVMKAEFVPAYR